MFHFNEKYERIFDRTRYLIMLKSSISDVYSHEYMKSEINSDDDSPLEKTSNMHNVVICIKSAFNKNHNLHYYQTFRKLFI